MICSNLSWPRASSFCLLASASDRFEPVSDISEQLLVYVQLRPTVRHRFRPDRILICEQCYCRPRAAMMPKNNRCKKQFGSAAVQCCRFDFAKKCEVLLQNLTSVSCSWTGSFAFPSAFPSLRSIAYSTYLPVYRLPETAQVF